MVFRSSAFRSGSLSSQARPAGDLSARRGLASSAGVTVWSFAMALKKRSTAGVRRTGVCQARRGDGRASRGTGFWSRWDRAVAGPAHPTSRVQ